MFGQISFFIYLSVILFLCHCEEREEEEVKVWLSTTLDKRNLLARQAGLRWEASDRSTSEHALDIDDSVTYQEIDGLGATLSDSSAWLIWEKMKLRDRRHLLTSLFDRREGIGLDAIRIAIGPSSFSKSNRTYAETCCVVDDFDIDQDKEYVIPLINAIQAINEDILVLASSWSPPAWMKMGDSLIGGQLKTNQFSNLGTYFTRFILEYQKANVPIYALIVQNEPQYRSCCYPSMWMDADEQGYFIANTLKKVFAKYALGTKIVASTNNWDILETHGAEVLKNEGARRAVSGIAFQCYRGAPQDQSKFHEDFPDVDLYLAECTDEGDEAKIKELFEILFRRAMHREVIGSFRNFARVVMKFNLVLDGNHGPRNGGCSNCLGMATLDTKTNRLTYNAAYYAYGHLSKFVRKGAKRIQSSTSTSYTMESVAFKNPDGEIVLLVYNNLKQYPINFKAQWGGRFFAYSLPPYGAATFVWKGRDQPKPKSAFERIEAESYAIAKSVVIENCNDVSGCGSSVTSVDIGAYLLYKNIDFGSGALSITYRTASNATGLVEVKVDDLHGSNNILALIVMENTGSRTTWKTKSADINKVTGVHDLYVVFKGSMINSASFNWFAFKSADRDFYKKSLEMSQYNFYKIVSLFSNKAFDVDSRERKRDTPVQQWEYYYVDWQKFHFIKSEELDGCYYIVVKDSRMVLEASPDSSNKRILVRQKPRNGGSKQAWRIVSAEGENGYSKIVSCHSDLVMEVGNSSTDNGELIVLARNQKIKLEQMFSFVLIEPFPVEFERRKIDP